MVASLAMLEIVKIIRNKIESHNIYDYELLEIQNINSIDNISW